MNAPLATLMFEEIFDELSDKQLANLDRVLQDYKSNYSRNYTKLNQHPFIKDLFKMINEQVEYRNQMESFEDVLKD